MSKHYIVYLKLIYYCKSTIIKKINNNKKNTPPGKRKVTQSFEFGIAEAICLVVWCHCQN